MTVINERMAGVDRAGNVTVARRQDNGVVRLVCVCVCVCCLCLRIGLLRALQKVYSMPATATNGKRDTGVSKQR